MLRIANPPTSVRLRDPPPPLKVQKGFRPGGGIGRHKGFKIPRLKGRAGSSPAPGTNSKEVCYIVVKSIVLKSKVVSSKESRLKRNNTHQSYYYNVVKRV
jgi:hypothetical protein